jgi:hypothetical protein
MKKMKEHFLPQALLRVYEDSEMRLAYKPEKVLLPCWWALAGLQTTCCVPPAA